LLGLQVQPQGLVHGVAEPFDQLNGLSPRLDLAIRQLCPNITIAVW
jgi:hypothetical protein